MQPSHQWPARVKRSGVHRRTGGEEEHPDQRAEAGGPVPHDPRTVSNGAPTPAMPARNRLRSGVSFVEGVVRCTPALRLSCYTPFHLCFRIIY